VNLLHKRQLQGDRGQCARDGHRGGGDWILVAAMGVDAADSQMFRFKQFRTFCKLVFLGQL
jgi:hypothetical protein